MTLIDLHSCFTNVKGNMVENPDYSNFNIWRGISGLYFQFILAYNLFDMLISIKLLPVWAQVSLVISETYLHLMGILLALSFS